ncbi:metal-dependent transcriptional regulator [Actinomycetaceae bacterium L2_0104]
MALTTSSEDYLRAIWKLSEWQDKPVSSGQLARSLGLSPSTVSEGVGKLVGMGLVRHAPYGAISLTEEGHRQAARMVRIHRLLETGLVEIFGYSWDEVHEEAEHLEHAVSDRFIERLDSALGYPERDPHGDVIPKPEGPYAVGTQTLHSLADAKSGETVCIDRVSDHDSDVLVYLQSVGLLPGARLRIREARHAVGLLTVELGEEEFEVSIAAARSVIVQHVSGTN